MAANAAAPSASAPRSLMGWLAVATAGTAGFALAFAAAWPYPGVSVDAAEYLAVADGVVRGHGFTMPYVSYNEPFSLVTEGERVPMTQFPPLYPALLAAAKLVTGLSLLGTARLIGSSAYFVTVAVAALLLWRYTERVWPALLGGALLIAPDLVVVHAMAWSEPVMIAGLLGALWMAARYAASCERADLVSLGVFAAAAGLARFAGLAVVAAACIVVAVRGRRGLVHRSLRTVGFAVATTTPVVAWFVRNALVAGVVSQKAPGWHPPGKLHLTQAAETVGGWLVPGRTTAIVTGIAVVIVAVAFGGPRLGRLLDLEAGPLPRLCALFALCYLVFVIASRATLDQNIPLDFRMLSPLHVLVVIGVCAALGSRGLVRPNVLLAAVLGAIAIVSVLRAGATARDFSSLEIAAYTSDAWRASETLAFAGSVSPRALIITNAPDPVWLWYRRASLIEPPRASLYTGEPNPRYRQQLRQLHAATRCRTAVVVFFDRPTRKPRRYIQPLLVAELGLRKTHRFADGEVYAVDEPRTGC